MSAFITFCARGCAYVIVFFPLWLQLFFGDCIGFLWFDVLRIRRKVALDNLRQCFPEMTEKQRVRIARKSVYHIGRSVVEILKMPASGNAKDQFHLEGRENLEAAQKKGKGVFMLTAHIGNGDWGILGLGLHGIKIYAIGKKIKFKALDDILNQSRRAFGYEFIPDRQSSLMILRLLKQNQIIGFMLDQFLGPPIGIRTTFFGRETGTPMGLALLAGRSGAAVVPTITYRLPNGHTKIVIEPEIPFVESGNKEETISRMTQTYCDVIEKWVRRVPEQWMWVHRRWKKYKY